MEEKEAKLRAEADAALQAKESQMTEVEKAAAEKLHAELSAAAAAAAAELDAAAAAAAKEQAEMAAAREAALADVQRRWVAVLFAIVVVMDKQRGGEGTGLCCSSENSRGLG